jgi:hypothetical protein
MAGLRVGASRCAGLPTLLHAAGHADLPHSVLDLGRFVGSEAMLAVERVCEGSGRLPTAPPTPPDRRPPPAAPAQHPCRDGLHTHRAHTTVSPTPPRRPKAGPTCRSRPAAIPLGDSHAVLAITLVGQRGSPEPLPSSQEARVIEHRVRHEPPMGPPASTAHSRAPSARRPRPQPDEQSARNSPSNRRPPTRYSGMNPAHNNADTQSMLTPLLA